MTATIVHIHDQQGQIDAANSVIAEQSAALAKAHATLLAVKPLRMPGRLRAQVYSTIKVIEGQKS